MSYANQSNPYYPEQFVLADQASTDARADFIAKTYFHLTGAIIAFAALEAVLLNMDGVGNIVNMMIGGRFSWFLVLGAFMLVSYVATAFASSNTSVGMQYLGLGLYVVAEAVIFLPILYIASTMDAMGNSTIIPTAGILTLLVFTALTAIVFITRKNFSFLGPALTIASFAALGIIVCSMMFGFNLGILFVAAMIVLASGYILYQTSNIMHEYRIGQHVAASLALFASVALLFWYILQLVMSLQSRD